jgi:glutamyl/glutaminyl-tRNA synthetase
MDQILLVMQQDLSKRKGIGDIALPDKVAGADDRRPALPNILRARKRIEDIARFCKEVAADHIGSAHIN